MQYILHLAVTIAIMIPDICPLAPIRLQIQQPSQ